MKVSYNWLQEYLEEKLPEAEKLAELLTMHSFEVEGVEEVSNDKILDVKILPNRSHDCLSHYGIASEIAAVTGLALKPLLDPFELEKSNEVSLSIKTDLSKRGKMILIKNLEIKESPAWIKERLLSMGQKPINSVVDVTNYLTYAFGQPMHAFDAHKVSKNKDGKYEMEIREAKEGEKVTLLHGNEHTLKEGMLVISDTEKVLDVAGVMGGLESCVTSETEHVILSLSHFDPVSVRKTAKTLGIRTDASHRFENGISERMMDRALPYALKLIKEVAEGTVEGESEAGKVDEDTIVKTTAEKISSILGVSIDIETILILLARQGIIADMENGEIVVTVPHERLDLDIPESIAEEVGRLYGYEKIRPIYLENVEVSEINPETYVQDVIKRTLVSEGFSEVYTYAFTNKGEVELENPLAQDKKFLRSDLADSLKLSLDHNFKYMDLLRQNDIKIFETGKVFKESGEEFHLSIGMKAPKSKKIPATSEVIANAIKALEEKLGVSLGEIDASTGVVEIDLTNILTDITVPSEYPPNLWKTSRDQVLYSPISPYPFSVRDVAVFVPNSVTGDEVKNIILKHKTDIMSEPHLFDTFVKGDKTSYAFRMIFQSQEKTLTDEEISAVTDPIYEALKAEPGFEVR